MKKRALSLLVSAAVLLTMFTFAMFSASATTVADLTAGLKKTVVQDLTNYSLHKGGCWWNVNATDAYVSEENGVYFADVSDTYKGYAFVKLGDLANNDIAEATYLTVTFGKQSLPVDAVIKVALEFNLGNDYNLDNGTTIYYDNGATELQSYTLTTKGGAMELKVGTADTITIFVPVSAIVYMWGSAKPSAEQLAAVTQIGFNFSDLGNKTLDLSNEKAASIKEIAMYAPAPTDPPADPPAMNAFVADYDKAVVQDLTDNYSMYRGNCWWNTSVTDPYINATKGLYFADKTKGSALIKLGDFANNNISEATYLAVTFCKQGLPVGAVIKVVLEFNLGNDYNLDAGTTIYYDNGAAEMKSYTLGSKGAAMELTVGAADTITAFIPVDGIVFMWGSAKPSVEQLAAVTQIGFNFSDLGNKDTDLSNEAAVSIKEIAAYAAKEPAVAPVTNLGGQIRGEAVDGKLALRFVFDLPCAGIGYEDATHANGNFKRALSADSKVTIDGTAYTVTDFGAILSLDDKSALTAEDVDANAVVKVPALNLYEVEDGKVTYTAVVTNVPDTDAGKATPIYARSYVAYEVDGETVYAYGEIISRSVNDILQ